MIVLAGVCLGLLAIIQALLAYKLYILEDTVLYFSGVIDNNNTDIYKYVDHTNRRINSCINKNKHSENILRKLITNRQLERH